MLSTTNHSYRSPWCRLKIRMGTSWRQTVPITPVSSRALNLVLERSASPARKLLHPWTQKYYTHVLPITHEKYLRWSCLYILVVINKCINFSLWLKHSDSTERTTYTMTRGFFPAKAKQCINCYSNCSIALNMYKFDVSLFGHTAGPYFFTYTQTFGHAGQSGFSGTGTIVSKEWSRCLACLFIHIILCVSENEQSITILVNN